MKTLSLSTRAENPFRIEGVVEPPYFTNRAEEIRRIREALLGAPARMLLYGERRMGKTSVLHMARRAAERKRGRVIYVDLSTASSPADMATRVLESATRVLGRSWGDLVASLVERLRVRVELVADPVSGLAIPTIEASLRSRGDVEQQETLVGVLDALDAMAGERRTTLGVILDEFQEIHRFGGEAAEWRLRGALQHHQRLSYVLSGSDTVLIRAMTGPKRAFYEMFDLLALRPMDPEHLAKWVDERLADGGVKARGIGAGAVGIAGPRTRDVVRLARASFEVLRVDPAVAEATLSAAAGRARPSQKRPREDAAPGIVAGERGEEPTTPAARAAADVLRRALARVVAEEDDRMRAVWPNLTPIQQNVLRAVAWGGAGLAARATLHRFGLGHGGTARNTALALADRGLLERRDDSPTGFGFDSPFARAWVVANALPDVGLLLPIDHAGYP